MASCFAVEAVYPASSLRSHHSQPLCPASDDSAAGAGIGALNAPDSVVVSKDGRYNVQLRYNNHAHQINLGITNAVQLLRLRDRPPPRPGIDTMIMAFGEKCPIRRSAS